MPAAPAVIDLDAPPPVAQETPGHRRDRRRRGIVVGQLRLIAVGRIAPNGRQPRQDFDEQALEELAASIREVGLLQPIVVRAVGGDDYELIMGERRWRAAQLAELDEIPAIVRQTSDDAMLRDALLENLHREQLHALEEAAAYTQLLNDFGCTHDELASRVGRSRSHITNTIRLLSLPPTVQRRVAAGVLSAGHARALLGFAARAQQEQMATRIVAEGLSVRAVEELAALAGPDKTPRRRTPRPATPGLERRGQPAVRAPRDAGQGRDGPQQGPDNRRIRLVRRPRADRDGDGAGAAELGLTCSDARYGRLSYPGAAAAPSRPAAGPGR